MEEYSQAQPPAQQPADTVDLRKAPKWLRRPVGASFGVRLTESSKLCARIG